MPTTTARTAAPTTVDWAAICSVCDQPRSAHQGSATKPTCPDPATITCPDCIAYWAPWVGPIDRFAVAEIHYQHEPSRRARRDHAAWTKHKPCHGLRYGVFKE